jgi:phosphomannomutase
MITVLAEARRKDVKLSTMVAELPSRFTYSDRLQNYATARSQALLTRLQQGDLNLVLARLTKIFGSLAGAAVIVNATDGLRVTFDTGDVIHLRPSGNAPELRCYTESSSMQRAGWLAGEVLGMVADMDCVD